jgi:hypothetical protein
MTEDMDYTLESYKESTITTTLFKMKLLGNIIKNIGNFMEISVFL